MKKSELEDRIESLEIQLKHVKNDYILTKEEHEKSTEKYLDILAELKSKNQKLQDLQKNLEEMVERCVVLLTGLCCCSSTSLLD